MIIPRRGFLLGLVSLIAAPAIVRIENIMPVRAIVPSVWTAQDLPFYQGPLLDAIMPDGRIERLTEINDGVVAKILASQFVYVR